MRLVAAGLLTASTLCFAGLAYGNGRFPEAQRLLEHPQDSNRLYLAGTYGLLVTDNRGLGWHYVCELSFALESLEGDPLLEILPEGALLGGMKDQLTRSADCGCAWQPVLAQSAQQTVVDLTLDAAGTALALVQDTSTFPSTLALFEANSAGVTWQKIADLPTDLPSAYTLDVAPSDPKRVYVSAYSPSLKQGVLAVSTNRGVSWNELPITSPGSSLAPYIAAVHPQNPDMVFVRTRVNDNAADFSAQDALLVTSNAGVSYSEVLHRQGMLLGFALSPDGSQVLAGYGDSITAGISTNPDDLGLYSASVTDLVFSKIMNATVTCLRWTARGVYACTAQDSVQIATPGMSVGFAPNADFTLQNPNPLSALLDLHQVQGPLGCTAALCSASWQTGADAGVAVCQQFGANCAAATSSDITCPVPIPPDAGALPDASVPGDAGADPDASLTGGSGGAAGSGGASGTSGASGNGGAAGDSGGPLTSSAGTSPSAPGSGEKGGCGCRQAPYQDAELGVPWLTLSGFLAVALRRRRQRPSESHTPP